MADIIEVIVADHRRIRRLLDALGDTARYGGGPEAACSLALLWRRLAEFLVHHSDAEQEICYPVLSGQSEEQDAQAQDAIADHDDIREAVREAALNPVASPAWARAVTAARRLAIDHIACEERGLLAALERRAEPVPPGNSIVLLTCRFACEAAAVMVG